MRKISWLHLSDLHIGKEEYNEQVVLDNLLEDLKKQLYKNEITLDFVFITGDLTYSGQENEFDRAGEFITKLTQISGVQKDNIILVPGNHDISRSQISFAVKNSRSSISSREDLSKIIENESERKIFTEGLTNYRTFLHKNFNWCNNSIEYPLSYTINKNISGISVSILALNTAWLAIGGSNEKGQILVGERQVREALEEMNDPNIVITLVHHPFEWLCWFDANDVKGILERRSDFILNGHEHRLDIIGRGSIFGKAFKISAGSTYETRNHLNSYNIVVSDLSKGTAVFYLRRFEDQDGGFWTEDNSVDNSITHGQIEIAVPQRLNELFTKEKGLIEEKQIDELWVSPEDSKIEIVVPGIPKELIKQIKSGECILFAGAGTSLDAGLPSWDELLKNMVDKVNSYEVLSLELKKELDYLLDAKDFLTVAEYCKERLGAHVFASVIKENLSIRNRNSLMHKILADIPFKGAVTSNYDSFIERLHNNSRVILPNEIEKLDTYGIERIFNDDIFPVFKIHGSYDDANSIILTDKDYRNLIFNKPHYRETLKILFKNKSLLFIGFSFRDSSINLLLQEIITATDGMAIPHFAFMSDVGNIKKDFFWRSMNIKVIPYPTIDGTHVVLKNMLDNLRNNF